MTIPPVSTGPVGVPPQSSTDREKLRQTARQLESVFVDQLFKVMRSTVGENPLIKQSNGEQMFTDMLDQRLSERAPLEWSGPHSIADSLYRQLSRNLPNAPSTPESK
jgi:flagellar protein FlgJ